MTNLNYLKCDPFITCVKFYNPYPFVPTSNHAQQFVISLTTLKIKSKRENKFLIRKLNWIRYRKVKTETAMSRILCSSTTFDIGFTESVVFD